MTPERPGTELTPQELTRYSRHVVLPEVGIEGQRRLKAARVLLVGAGGLGSPLGLYLAAAGVGHLGIVDFDVVELSNLQRQVLHGTSDVGRPKVESAAERLRGINPEIDVAAYAYRLSSENALELLRAYDVIIDGTDNFPTRYLVNDACVLLGKPSVYGAIFRFHGQVSVFSPPAGPCYRCLYPEPPPPETVPSCAEGGVLGILPGVIGSLQATEAIKLILGAGEPLIGRMLLYDALEMKFRELKIKRDPACLLCGGRRTITTLIDYEEFCNARSAKPPAGGAPLRETTAEEVKARLDRRESFDLLDVRSSDEWQVCRIEGAKLIPVGDLPARMGELDASGEIVVYCKTGVRSARAAEMLRSAGFANVSVLKGGITEWAARIDPGMPSY